jgi:hypothetical protein
MPNPCHNGPELAQQLYQRDQLFGCTQRGAGSGSSDAGTWCWPASGTGDCMPACAAAGQGSVTAPGCLAATPIEAPITVEDGYPTQVVHDAQHLLHLLAAWSTSLGTTKGINLWSAIHHACCRGCRTSCSFGLICRHHWCTSSVTCRQTSRQSCTR